jgi:hypothetical protein
MTSTSICSGCVAGVLEGNGDVGRVGVPPNGPGDIPGDCGRELILGVRAR